MPYLFSPFGGDRPRTWYTHTYINTNMLLLYSYIHEGFDGGNFDYDISVSLSKNILTPPKLKVDLWVLDVVDFV